MRYGDNANLAFYGCVYCWGHGIESTIHLSDGVRFWQAAFRDQLDFSYIHNCAWPVNGGAGYNINLTFGASEIYMFDNIDMLCDKVMVVRASGSGSVFAYNYADDQYINGSDNWVETGINCSHLAGSHHVLAEGNYASNYDSDSTHGSAGHCTAFRNYFSGFRRAFTALDGTTVDDINNLPGGNAPLRAISDNPYTYWDLFVGNVLGTSGHVSGLSARCTVLTSYGCLPAIIATGWNSAAVGGSQDDGSDQISYPASPSGTITGPACLTSGKAARRSLTAIMIIRATPSNGRRTIPLRCCQTRSISVLSHHFSPPGAAIRGRGSFPVAQLSSFIPCRQKLDLKPEPLSCNRKPIASFDLGVTT